MRDDDFEELLALACSPRAGDRLKAMDRITAKSGRQVVRRLDDARVVPVLIDALGDADRRVQRAAARGLRTWVSDVPSAFESALTAYATDRFDGTYSHAGLYETRAGKIWIPRFAALKGHAALLRDANTDRYFRFDFYAPGQAPAWIPDRQKEGHLVLLFIPEWSYSRQRLIADFDDRLAKASAREQLRYADAVIGFYREAALRYDVRVHRAEGGGGHHRTREFDVERIDAAPVAKLPT